MGKGTAIQWCHHSFNPWWGCARVSPGCENCYAESFAKRAGFGPTPIDPKKFPVWGAHSGRRFFGEEHWKEPLRWEREAVAAGERHRVFCASMADVCEVHSDPGVNWGLQETRERLRSTIEQTPHLDWLLLTKRPENAGVLAGRWGDSWPSNTWFGVTAEDNKRASIRIPLLLATRGPAIKFVSYEPALEFVDFGLWMPRGVSWGIVGGESSGGARPFDLGWARAFVAAGAEYGVPVFVKQLGARPYDSSIPLEVDVDGGSGAMRARNGNTLKLRDRAGGDWNEWPADLRVREWPKEEVAT